jgi:hypothetical protein
MLAEIARVALAIGQELYPSHSLSDLDIGAAEGRGDVCPRERLAFLTLVWPRLTHALRIIEKVPAAALTAGVREVRIEQGSLKRASQTAVLDAIRSGDFFSVQESRVPLARRLGGRLPRRIGETAAVPTFHTPINRAVKAILVQLAGDLGCIIALAQSAEAPDVARQAEALREAVRRCLRRDPWRFLAPTPVQHAYPLASGPAYRYFFEQWRHYRDRFAFDWTNPLFTLPARETWLLYEYYCLFTVAAVLRNIGFHAVSASDLALCRSGMTFSLEKGRASRLVFRRKGGPPVTLHYNPSFPRKEMGPANGWHSRSHSLRPDISLERDGSLLLFDAKFKSYAEPIPTNECRPSWSFREGALLPDIQQMHTYRDAIVFGEQENVVSEAWLLYAGRITAANPDIVAYPRSTPAQPFGVGRIGAILLRPDGEPEALRKLVQWFCELRTG